MPAISVDGERWRPLANRLFWPERSAGESGGRHSGTGDHGPPDSQLRWTRQTSVLQATGWPDRWRAILQPGGPPVTTCLAALPIGRTLEDGWNATRCAQMAYA